MLISVIIPTLNRSDLLASVLESLIRQTYPQDHYEIIVVDNGSTDQTHAVCQRFSQNLSALRYFFDARPGLHIGRNLGLKVAKGSILAYCDDDIQAFPTWLEGIAESFEDPKVGLVGGKCLPDYETPPPPWLDQLWQTTLWGASLSYYSIMDFGDQVREISPSYIWGCNFSARRDLLLEVGGFHPDGMPRELRQLRGDGETAVACAIAALGYKALYCPKASIYHRVTAARLTKDYIYLRAFNQGISDSYTEIRRREGLRRPFPLIMTLRRAKHRYRAWRMPRDDVKRLARRGWFEGFVWHQQRVRRDPELLRWVLKPDYLDE